METPDTRCLLYFVTAGRDGSSPPIPMAGPFMRHQDALALVPAVSGICNNLDPVNAPWASYGTASWPLNVSPVDRKPVIASRP